VEFRMSIAVMILALSGADLAMAQIQSPADRINAALARARQAGIPVSLLDRKIAEGKAKGVSPERIAAAIERREVALERASQALQGHSDASSLSVGADAIESGVGDAVLKAVADSAPRERRNVAIAALTELVQQGHVPDAALERVKLALKRGPDALANLPAEAAADRRGAGASGGQSGAGAGRPGVEPGPPVGVPAPGKPPQAGKPTGAPSSSGQPTTPARSGR
jgi:hypothetical protein